MIYMVDSFTDKPGKEINITSGHTAGCPECLWLCILNQAARVIGKTIAGMLRAAMGVEEDRALCMCL